MNNAFLECNDIYNAVIPVNPTGATQTGDRVKLSHAHRFGFLFTKDAGSGHTVITLKQADAATGGNTKNWAGIEKGWYRSAATLASGGDWTEVDVDSHQWDTTSLAINTNEQLLYIEAECQTMDADNDYVWGYVEVENVTGIASFTYFVLGLRFGGPPADHVDLLS